MITLCIAAMLLVWAAYAFSGPGLIRRLPLLRTALVAIGAIYLTRGLVPLPLLIVEPELVDSFVLWGSLIVLAYGLAYAVGTWTQWRRLGKRASPGETVDLSPHIMHPDCSWSLSRCDRRPGATLRVAIKERPQSVS